VEGKDVHTPPEGFPGRPVSERRRDTLPRRSRVSGWALAAVLAVIAIVLYAVRYALLPFVFAAAVAFVMDPVIRAVQRLGSPRWVAGILLYLAILASLGSVGYWIARTAGADLVYVIANAPEILRHFLTEMAGQQGITIFGHAYTPDQIVRYLRVAAHRLINATTFAQIAGTAASAPSRTWRSSPPRRPSPSATTWPATVPAGSSTRSARTRRPRAWPESGCASGSSQRTYSPGRWPAWPERCTSPASRMSTRPQAAATN